MIITYFYVPTPGVNFRWRAAVKDNIETGLAAWGIDGHWAPYQTWGHSKA